MSSPDPAIIAKTILERLTNGADKPTQKAITAIAQIPDRADLLPSMFRVRGELYSLENYPQFKEMYTRHVIPDTIYMCGRQLGKCGLSTSTVSTYNGSCVMLKDIKVGDRLLQLDNNFRSTVGIVQNVFETGMKDVYCISTRLGSKIYVSADHGVRELHGFNTINKGLVPGSRVAHLHNGGVFTGVAEIDNDRIVLTAYMLGDGSCIDPHYQLTAKNDEIVNEVKMLTQPADIHVAKYAKSSVFRINFHRCHPIYTWFKEDDIHNHYPYNKAFPGWVFDLTREQTKLFVERLWATDGAIYLSKGNMSIDYCSTSQTMIKQLQQLLCKFGITACLREKHPKCQTNRDCRLAYEIRIEGPRSQKLFLDTFHVPGKPAPDIAWKQANSNRQTVPIEITATLNTLFTKHKRRGLSLRDALRRKPKYPPSIRKLEEYIQAARTLNLQDTLEFKLLENLQSADVDWDTVTDIQYIGMQQTYDLEVTPNRNYIMDGIVVHNSMNLSRSEVLDCLLLPHFQVLYVAPLAQQTMRYSTLYLREAINSCSIGEISQDSMFDGNDADATIVKAVQHQSFGNGSGIQLTYAKTSSDRARGIYADRIDFDEIQDQLVDNIPIISESLTASSWGGIRRFTGTAKTTDNTIEGLWQESSQSEWVMKCDHCNHWNIPTVDGKVLDMVRSDGPCCVRCGKRLNVRAGEFVPAYPDRVRTFKGLHIPQIVVPAITENPRKWSALFRKILRLPLPILLQEVMGISCSLGARIITQADIVKQSTLPSVVKLRSNLSRYIFTVGGIDWGIAEHDSFTVHTIIGVKSDGTFDVIWARRFIGFNPDEVLQAISQAHLYYGCRMVAADFGMGFDKNYLLGTRFGLPVVQIQLVRQNKLLTFAPPSANQISRWSVDKTTALELMFIAIKYGRIFFPPQEEFNIYTEDLLSPYEEITETAGMTSRHFMRNPARPDDFAMALCFACLVAMQCMGVNMAEIVPTDAMGAGSMPGIGMPPVQDFTDPKDILSSVR